MTRLNDLPRLTEDPWHNLAMAVAVQALLDACSPSLGLSRPARAWLASEHGSGFLHLLNLDSDVLLAWLEKKGPDWHR